MTDVDSRDAAGAGHGRSPGVATLGLCALALVGFAANSLLARGALGGHAIDAASYTLVRLASGAVMLWALTAIDDRETRDRSRRGEPTTHPRWMAPAALAVYAVAFSYSYVRIGAAMGALVLFPTVKLALLVEGHWRGERPDAREWTGAVAGLCGLLVLTAPGLGRPDPIGVLLMVSAGLAWGVYTVAGQRVAHPVRATRDNFAGASLVALPLLWPVLLSGHASSTGLWLAVVSGSVTSALAYVLWYRVVPRLTGMQLGLAQLAVPVLAGLGAVVVLGEAITLRLVGGAALIAAGVAIALMQRSAR